jgi:hypothetical protein
VELGLRLSFRDCENGIRTGHWAERTRRSDDGEEVAAYPEPCGSCPPERGGPNVGSPDGDFEIGRRR